ncbi:MAG: winged helix-turn-helix domain-containing protein [Acidobacteriota bacterium]
MPASQTRLLTLFLNRAGALITREEIASHLWKDPSNIDVSNGINTAVNRLRYTLKDDTVEPAYIETVIGLGYRFIASVEPPAEDLQSRSLPMAAAVEETDDVLSPQAEVRGTGPVLEKTEPPTAGRRYAKSAVVAAVILVGFATLTAVLLLRHTSRASASPSLAPLIPDHFLTVTFNDSDDKVTAEAVSPGGDTIAYADHSGVAVIWLDSRVTRLLASPPQFEARRIDWFPEGQRLALSGTAETSQRQQVWELFLNGAAPRLIADDADLAAVSPDGSSIAMTRHGDTEIDIAGADEGPAHTLLRAGNKENFAFLLWARSGRYLIEEHCSQRPLSATEPAVTRSGSPLNDLEALKAWGYETVDAGTGKVLARADDLGFTSGYVLDDGRLFYAEAGQSKTGPEIRFRMLRTRPSDGRIVEAPFTLRTTFGSEPRAFTASANGKQIAIIVSRSTADTFIGKLRLPGPVLEGATQITHRALESYPHAWSPRDDAVLIENNTLGKDAVFEQRLDRSAPQAIAQLPGDAAMAQFAPDGKWILFLGFGPQPARVRAVFRVPVAGGAPEQLPIPGEIEEFQCSASRAGRCVLREAVQGKEFVYYALDPVRGMGRELARTPWEPALLGDWSLSPDGSTAAIASHNSLEPSIHLLSLVRPGGKFDDLHLKDAGTPLGANWSSDGRGLFVETRTDSAYNLLYVDLQGRVRLLRESPTPIWGISSHNGTMLAYPAVTFRSNVLTEKTIDR